MWVPANSGLTKTTACLHYLYDPHEPTEHIWSMRPVQDSGSGGRPLDRDEGVSGTHATDVLEDATPRRDSG